MFITRDCYPRSSIVVETREIIEVEGSLVPFMRETGPEGHYIVSH